MKYRAEIDGLRALAVLPVILFHAGFEWFSGGFVGVDVFFVISGYLITTIIISEMAEGKFSIINFYERRARRILPALFFVMVACLLFAILLLAPSDLKDFGQSLVSTATFSSNFLFWWERGYFGTALELKPLLHTWSLAVEEQYYIIFPLFLTFAWKFGIRKITIFLILIFLISLSFAHFSSIYGVFDRIITGSFYLIPTRAWELLVGVFIAIYFYHFKVTSLTKFNQFFSLLGLCMVTYSVIFFDSNTPFPSLYTLIPTLGTGLIIISAQKNTIVNEILSFKPLVFIGLLSYSAYLWHQPIFAFTRHKLSHDISDQIFFLLITISIFLAFISWRWVEKPFRNRNKISRKGIFTFSAVGILMFVILGSILSLSNGLLYKYEKVEQKIYKEFMELGSFNPVNMRLANLKDFDKNDTRKKLLVIGDSYAEDLVNAIKESDLETQYQLSTYRIPANCGVLFVERDIIEEFQPLSCRQRPNFFNESKLESLLIEADHIWIESSWLDWQIDFLPKSLIRLQEINSNLVLFGSKKFQITSASEYKNNYGLEGINEEFEISNRQKSLTAELEAIAKRINIKFVDPMYVICGSKKVCKHSFDNKGIISVDGGHLTPYGARHFGYKLDQYIKSEEFLNN